MKKRIIKNIISNLLVLLALLTCTPTFGQEININQNHHPFIYLSSAYVSVFDNNHVTSDPFYSKSKALVSEKTVRMDIGLQANDNLSFELGFLTIPLLISNSLRIDNSNISGGSSSRSRILFYSLRLQHGLHLFKNRLFLKTGLGYALGKDNGDGVQWGPSSPKTTIAQDNTIITTRTINFLHNGTSNFLTLNLGLEFRIFRKLNIFGTYSIYKGFTDLQSETIDYTINDTNGSFTATTDGSFSGWELGLRYNFR